MSPALRERLGFVGCWLGLAALVAAPWWSSALLPLMDYPMFLAFARVVQDAGVPGAPLDAVYTTGFPLAPTALPLRLCAGLARWTELETAGRLLWTAYAVGLLGASVWLTRAFGLSRWSVLFVAPLVMNKWVSSGFVGFATGLPLLLIAVVATHRAFSRPTWSRLLGAAAALLCVGLWHALLLCLALLLFGLLWLAWRAPSPRTRALGALPLAPPLVLLGWWALLTVFQPAPVRVGGPRLRWAAWTETLDPGVALGKVLMLFEGSRAWAGALGLAWVVALLARRAPTTSSPPGASYRAAPVPLLALGCLLCFLLLPADALGVEIVGPRFLVPAALFAALTFSPPARLGARHACWLPALGVGLVYLVHVNLRFRAFDAETRPASELIDSLPPRSTLLAPLRDSETKSFANVPLRELQQYATIRGGGLPVTSFASYGYNYIRFRRPTTLPQFRPGQWQRAPQLRGAVTHVLLRGESAPPEAPVSLLERRGDWWLYQVCAADPCR